MDVNHVSGTAFKKIMVNAHGHHAYMPHEVKKAINELNLHKHVRDGAHVSKHVAKEIMHKMQQKGLTHHMMTTVDNYVNKEFRKEEHRQEAIKHANLEQRQKDLAAERAAAAQKDATGKHPADKNKPAASALHGGAAAVPHSAWSGSAKKIDHPTNHVQVGHVTSSALTGAQWHAHEAPAHLPEELSPEHHGGGSISTAHHEEETIDLAID